MNNDNLGLSDSVNLITSRVDSVLLLTQSEFVDEDSRTVSHHAIFNTLETVRLEVCRIEETINKFCEDHRKKS